MDHGNWVLEPGRWAIQPLRELEGKQLAEEAANGHAGEIIAGAARGVFFFFIISINRTIEGQLHKPREANGPAVFNLSGYDFSKFAQWQQKWCGFS